MSPAGGPSAVHAELGWALQGPYGNAPDGSQTCYFTSLRPPAEDIYQRVEWHWQVDVIPFCSDKPAGPSCQDDEAVTILESRTVKVNFGDTLCYGGSIF